VFFTKEESQFQVETVHEFQGETIAFIDRPMDGIILLCDVVKFQWELMDMSIDNNE
jgi:hypothetical protein